MAGDEERFSTTANGQPFWDPPKTTPQTKHPKSINLSSDGCLAVSWNSAMSGYNGPGPGQGGLRGYAAARGPAVEECARGTAGLASRAGRGSRWLRLPGFVHPHSGSALRPHRAATAWAACRTWSSAAWGRGRPPAPRQHRGPGAPADGRARCARAQPSRRCWSRSPDLLPILISSHFDQLLLHQLRSWPQPPASRPTPRAAPARTSHGAVEE
jgi:hypothetical protein